MTAIAGLVSLRSEFSVPDDACRDLRAALSRHAGEQIHELRGPRYYLAKFDVGALGAPGLHVDQDGAVTLLAGEPLLATDEKAGKRPRSDDLLTLHRNWRQRDRSALRQARGAFCLAHFDPVSHRLELVADKLGLRSLYYYVSDDYVLFASALRVLESSRFVDKRMDVRGVTEIAAMRIALADRTPYAGVKLLKSGQIVGLSDDERSSEVYWRWDRIRPATASMDDLLREAYRLFIDAVRLRLGSDRIARAFLSGGLDSRCIVTALKAAGAKPYTYSIAFPGTLDEPLADAYARAIGSVHRHVPLSTGGDVTPLNNVLPLLDETATAPEERPERPRVLWSGEGGSGVIGYVSQTAELVELLRQGQTRAAAERYLAGKRQRLPRKLFARPVADLICDLPERGLQERLEAFDCPDPGRAISLFDLVDYQSRHLNDHYETIDLTRVELETPFYDSDFVAFMYSVPIDACLYHDFYHKWLLAFPPVTVTVPWQTYPGHRPCPLPLPEGFRDQWSRSRSGKSKQARALNELKALDRMGSDPAFPHPLLNGLFLRFARWTTRLGSGNYGYALAKAAVFSKYWHACGGRYVMPQRTT